MDRSFTGDAEFHLSASDLGLYSRPVWAWAYNTAAAAANAAAAAMALVVGLYFYKNFVAKIEWLLLVSSLWLSRCGLHVF